MAPKKTTSSLANSENQNTPIPADNQKLYDMLAKMQARIDELEKTEGDKIKEAQDVYDGPLKASYWLWAGVPVLSYTSFKKDEAFDWLYKDPSGAYIDNHYVRMELADGTTTKPILRNSFDSAKVKSVLSEFDIITDKGDKVTKATHKDLQRVNPAKFVFNIGSYGDVQVLPNCVN